MDENKKRYLLQQNCCVSLFCKTKKEYYGNFDKKKVSNKNSKACSLRQDSA